MPPVRDVLNKAADRLAAFGIETPRLDAEVLLAFALKTAREEILGRWDEVVPENRLKIFKDLIARRLKREPVARITGVQEFWSLAFRVNEATLVPRPDSEALVETALQKIPAKGPFSILDLGTGSGCLLLSLLSERPGASGIGVDSSRKALACAFGNAKNLKLNARATFVKGDWTIGDLPKGPFGMVIANPPYIETAAIAKLAPEVRDFGPKEALDGGKDGLAHYRLIAPAAQKILKPGGWLVFEIGESQEQAVRRILTGVNYKNLETRYDLAGKPRVVAGLKS